MGFIFIAPKTIGVLLQVNKLNSSVPYDNADAIITSKELTLLSMLPRLSIKSPELPKGGDLIRVDSYIYGAASIGDKICVQYRSTSENPQYGVEYVGKGSCSR